MFAKVLVANRGEIAVRAFRAAYELGVRTVAVFPHEDRNAIHRIKADEAYRIGERGHPVRAYLDINEIMRAAKESDADAIYPGYGFLSENPELARACAEAGITFIGPPANVLELAGNKVRALMAARAAGVPTLTSTPPSANLDELMAGAEAIGFRYSSRRSLEVAVAACDAVQDPTQLRESISAAMREAEGAFGDPTVFIEQAVGRPRHIEVQVLADTQGKHHPPLRARLLRTTASPEGDRDRSGTTYLRGVAERAVR
jgi:pyruvate carboxylase